PEGEAELRARLETLVKADVLVRGPEGYRFTNQRLRELLFTAVAPARKIALHRRVAEAMLARGSLSANEQLAAGLHLLDAHDERGSDLLVDACLKLARTPEAIGSSVRLIEAALEAFRARGESETRRLVLLITLGAAAYLVDRRLDRYELELLESVDRVLGLARARALAERFGMSKLGRNLGSLIGLGLGAVAYWLRPKRERPCSFVDMVTICLTGMLSLAGKATVCLDGPSVRRITAKLEPFAALGRKHSAGYTYAYCYGLTLVMEDRYARTYEYFRRLEAILNTPGSLPLIWEQSRRLFEGGVHYVLGVFESFRGDRHALERADALEATGYAMHELVAEQLRVQYHGFRGEAEEVRKAQESMEGCAIQLGFSWQVETWSAIVINLYGALWQDLIVSKRALDETARMAHEVPSLTRYAITSDATYQLLRGKPRECIELYKSVLPKEKPLERIGWSVSHGLLANAYNEVGEHGQAKAICETVFATVDPADEPYCGMRLPTEIAYAFALAGVGEQDAAQAHLHGLLQRYAPVANPLITGTIHETAARIAFARGDRKTFTLHLKEVEATFTKLGNPALIARFQHLSDIAGEGGGMGARVAVMREVKAFDAAVGGIADMELGARHMLAWLMDKVEGLDGYLLARADEEPQLVAATSTKEPPPEVFEVVSHALRQFGTEEDTTNLGRQVATQTGRDGSASHLFLLSYLEGERYCAEGALVLLGRATQAAPPVRFELLQAAAKQLRRLRGAA
ncbi:MAG TPA: hypothetical protein VHM19_13275, partial [Polyangiales bacterium]|nr:hypothetical protein [Polyangiales bacterium]